MKILFYNWANFNSNNVGGGVGVYQKNIIDAFAKYTDDKVYFLFSGEIYSPTSKKPYVKKIKHQYPNCQTYAIVNSTVIAPAWFTFHNLSNYLSETDSTMLDLLTNFIKSKGGFDILHLNNLEGMPLNILKIKERFPEMKIVFSLHNYMPFCPLVNLFDFSEHKICEDYHNGCQCGFCCNVVINKKNFKSKIKNFGRDISIVHSWLKVFHKKGIKRRAKKLLRYDEPIRQSEIFQQYRQKNIEYINKYVDVILSVSQRVKDIATHYGIDPKRNYVSYIGTKVADTQLERSLNTYNDTKPLTIAYLGYVREDKGFFFLLKALEELSEKYTKKIRVKLIARGINNPFIQERLKKLKDKFYDIIDVNGYTHNKLPELLSDAHLGIVPVIWEDNLPQVAIELVSMGIPILASSAGGPSELSSSSYFKFKVASVEDFNKKLAYLLDNPKAFDDFWDKKKHLPTLKEHINELKQFYKAENIFSNYYVNPDTGK